MKKKRKKQVSEPEAWRYLDAWFMLENESGRWTTQEIIDSVRDTVRLSMSEVNGYMEAHNYLLERVDDRLVWTLRHKEEENNA